MKYKRLLICILLSILLTGCMQVTNNLRVFDDATYQSEMEIYIPVEIYNSSDDVKRYINTFISIAYKFDYRQEEVVTIDDKEYHSIMLKINRTNNKDDKVKVSIEDEQALLVHDLSLSEDYLFELDAFGLGDDYKDILANQGINIMERIQMPGKIISSNCGKISGDILVVNIIESDISKIIVRSTIETDIGNLFIILITVTIALVTLIIIFIQLNKKKNKKDDGPNINIEEENLTPTKTNDILDTLALEEKEDNYNLPY